MYTRYINQTMLLTETKGCCKLFPKDFRACSQINAEEEFLCFPGTFPPCDVNNTNKNNSTVLSYISSNRPNDRDPNTLSVIDTCRRELFLSPPPQPGVGWDMAVAAVCQHASTQGIGMKSGRISLCPVETVKNLTQNRS